MALACEVRGLDYVLTDRRALHLEDPASIRAALETVRPWAVVNAAGWARPDAAEDEPDACMAVNADGAEALARACKRLGVPLVAFSSHLVFDGLKPAAYVESDAPNPLNAYGRSKAEAERRILASGGEALLVRTSTFFGGRSLADYATRVLAELGRGRGAVLAADDRFISPTYLPDLVRGVLDLLVDGELGLWHLANAGRLSWAEFARAIAARAGHDPARIEAAPAEAVGWRAPRPRAVALGSERARLLPDIHAALDRFALERPRAAPGKRRARNAGREPRTPALAMAAE